MKKKLMRILVMVGTLAVLAICTTACSKKAECELCGEVKSCKTYTVAGEKATLCKDCHKTVEALSSLMD